MSAPQFTPGPWTVIDNRHVNAFWICAPDEFTSHAEVRAGSGEAFALGDELANARLIAAAPELYAALDDMIELARPNIYPQPDKPDSAYGRLERARLALAKARGGQ